MKLRRRRVNVSEECKLMRVLRGENADSHCFARPTTVTANPFLACLPAASFTLNERPARGTYVFP